MWGSKGRGTKYRRKVGEVRGDEKRGSKGNAGRGSRERRVLAEGVRRGGSKCRRS